MSADVPFQATAGEPARPTAAHPGFFMAWRGIWLFAWRSQLTWRKLPAQLAGLLVLPVLVYITTSSPEAWAKRHPLLGQPAGDVSEFSHRAQRSGQRLEPQQEEDLRKIFEEEYARAESDWSQNAAARSEAAGNDQARQITACYERITQRAKGVLNDRQADEFGSFLKRKSTQSVGRAREPMWGWTAPFYHWLVDFYFFVVLPLACVSRCGALIRDELQANTLGFLTTRPLRRDVLLMLKYLAAAAWLQLVMGVQTLLLFAVGWIHHVPSLGVLFPLFLGAQALAVFAWSALGVFLGLVSKRYVALALVYGVIVEMGIGRIPTNINTLSMMRHLKTLLAHNAPLEKIYDWPATGAPFSAFALVLAALIFVGFAAALFTFREYHHTTEMQK